MGICLVDNLFNGYIVNIRVFKNNLIVGIIIEVNEEIKEMLLFEKEIGIFLLDESGIFESMNDFFYIDLVSSINSCMVFL